MAQNPFLHVMVQSGYYDGACDYFNAKYSLWQMDPEWPIKRPVKLEGIPERTHDVPAQAGSAGSERGYQRIYQDIHPKSWAARKILNTKSSEGEQKLAQRIGE